MLSHLAVFLRLQSLARRTLRIISFSNSWVAALVIFFKETGLAKSISGMIVLGAVGITGLKRQIDAARGATVQ